MISHWEEGRKFPVGSGGDARGDVKGFTPLCPTWAALVGDRHFAPDSTRGISQQSERMGPNELE